MKKIKILRLAVAAAALSMFAGCIVSSVYPFYTEQDLIFDPGLAGRWANDNKTNELWQFTGAHEKYYLLTTVDDQETNSFEAHFFGLRSYQFLDLLTTNRGEFQLPIHLISKVMRSDTNVSMEFMDYGWLAKLLETNPAVLRHIVVPENSGNTNTGQMLYLTADTKDLQAFLLKHADDTNAFNSSSAVELKRAP